MAADPEGGEFKPYSQFPFERDNWPSYFGGSDSFPGFGSSAFSSPVESEIGSYEIESDKDDDGGSDYTAELTRRMAQYMLQDDDSSSTVSFRSDIQSKSRGLSGSPISTLWSPLGSSHGSPEGPSKEPSPPTTPMVADRGGLDISCNVFSKLEKIKVPTDGKSIQTGLENRETGSSSSSSSSSRSQDSSSSSHDQARALKNHKRKQQQFMKQRGSAAIQAKQAPGEAGGNSGTKPGGSSGTGVFLPRHVNYNRPAPTPQPPQPSKKKGCSTVLIPVRVLQALQLHYDRMDAETRQKITGFTALREAVAGAKNGTYAVNQSHPEAAAGTATATAKSQTDMGLPQEWTY